MTATGEHKEVMREIELKGHLSRGCYANSCRRCFSFNLKAIVAVIPVIEHTLLEDNRSS